MSYGRVIPAFLMPGTNCTTSSGGFHLVGWVGSGKVGPAFPVNRFQFSRCCDRRWRKHNCTKISCRRVYLLLPRLRLPILRLDVLAPHGLLLRYLQPIPVLARASTTTACCFHTVSSHIYLFHMTLTLLAWARSSSSRGTTRDVELICTRLLGYGGA